MSSYNDFRKKMGMKPIHITADDRKAVKGSPKMVASKKSNSAKAKFNALMNKAK